jgi:hypothetical protein
VVMFMLIGFLLVNQSPMSGLCKVPVLCFGEIRLDRWGIAQLVVKGTDGRAGMTRPASRPDGLLVLALDGTVLWGPGTTPMSSSPCPGAMIHNIGGTVAQVRLPAATTETTQVEALLAGIPDLHQHNNRVILAIDAAHTRAQHRMNTYAPRMASTTS